MKEYAGKVLIIVQNLPVPFDRRVWLEARKLKDHGIKVSVISPKSAEFNKSYEVIEDIAVYRYTMPIEAEGKLSYLFEFVYAWIRTAMLSVKIWFREGFDVIQACNPPDTYFILGFLYKLLGVKFVFDHHDLCPEMFAAKYEKKSKLLHKGLLLLEKLTLKTANIVLSTNDSYKRIAVQRGGKSPEDVYVVRTGPDLGRLQIRSEERGLKNGKPYLVCYLGEMCPQDGVDYLLRSIQTILNEFGRKDIQFVLMGGGPAMPELKTMSEDMGLSSHVYFTGRVDDETMCRYLSTADLCVDPDPWSEWATHSTMNKILEYMTFGKAIVTYDLEETHISAQKAALYVEPDNEYEFAKSVVELIDDPNRRETMGHYGLNRVKEKLSWRHTHKALLAAYHRLFPNLLSADDAEKNLSDLILSRIQASAIDELLVGNTPVDAEAVGVDSYDVDLEDEKKVKIVDTREPRKVIVNYSPTNAYGGQGKRYSCNRMY